MTTLSKIGKSVLAASIAIACQSAWAQTQSSVDEVTEEENSNAGVMEEVVITGIKRSMMSSVDMKRSSDLVVDGISAEDIGVFPDRNVAEALQRITGVSIDRSGGEGRFVTVRGLGPEYNTILANGRTLATENAGREFSLDVLPAEMISGAEVYKTSQASMIEGAIGGTVNMKTWRPFDIRGQRIIGTVEGTYDDQAESTDFRVAGLYSNTWADDTFGALVSFSYSERTANLQSYFSDGTRQRDFDTDGDGVADVIGADTIESARYQVFEQDRDRTGGTAVLQWRPNDRHEITFDGLISIFDVNDSSTELAIPFNVGGAAGWDNVVFDENNMVIAGDKLNQWVDVIRAASPRKTQTYQYGVNWDWQVTDQFTVNSDLAYSKATSDVYGDRRFYVVRAYAPVSYQAGPDIPLINVGTDITDPSIWYSHVGSNYGNDTADTVLEGKVDMTFHMDMGVFQSIQGGLYFSDREKDVDSSRRGVCGRCYNNARVHFTDSSIFYPFEQKNFLSGVSGQFANQWIGYGFDDVMGYYGSEAALSQLDPEYRAQVEALMAAGGYNAQPNDGGTTNVQEDSWATYVQFILGGDYSNGLGWSAVLGGRLISTDQTSTGQFVEMTSITDIPNPDGTIENRAVTYSDPEFVGFSNNYTEFLPSFNFRTDLTENLLVRLGYSQTMTRPTISALSTGVSYNVNVGAERITGQNPELKPYKSDNYDASLEWYFDDLGSATFAVFHKELDSFLATTTEQVEYFGVTFGETRPRNAGAGTITGFELAYQQAFENGLGVQANYTYIDSQADFSSLGGDSDMTVIGLSKNNYNLVGFFENDTFAVRLAYNYRDDFLAVVNTWLGGPFHTAEYGQLDLRASWNITPNFQLYLDAINLTDASLSQYYDFDPAKQVGYLEIGTRYGLGLRVQF